MFNKFSTPMCDLSNIALASTLCDVTIKGTTKCGNSEAFKISKSYH